MGKGRGGGGTPATVLLERAGIGYRLHSYDHDPRSDLSYGEEAARALGVGPERVFKTLVASVDGQLTVAVVPVAGSLDLKALAAAAGGKRAVMAEPAQVQRSTGYVLGGVSPLGQKKRLATVIDSSARRFEQIHVSGGRRGLEISLAPNDLAQLTGGRFADIAG